MNYIPRHAESAIKELAAMFGAVLITGARQVGKTTLLEHMVPTITMLSFDNATTVETAANAPELFFVYNTPPLFLDEVQKAPNLFSEMKQVIDKTRQTGLFYLTGSQQFHLMEQVSESLAGRIGILTLTGLSLREENKIDCYAPFIPIEPFYEKRRASVLSNHDPVSVWRRIHRGSMPALVTNPHYDWEKFYGSYVQTYIERDVRSLSHVGDELKFQAFMGVLAARTGQMLNLTEVAGSVGISQPTAQRWLSILVASNVVFLLRPYFNNRTKRAIKTPKLYFTDTGLAAYLAKWNTPEVLREGAMAGAYFETFVIMEIVKSYYNAGVLVPPLYYYRDVDRNEIDLLIENDGILHPLEIKMTGAPKASDIKAFRLLDRFLPLLRGPGGLICLHDRLQALSELDTMIPLTYL